MTLLVFYNSHKNSLCYERKENHVLVMAFTRCVRENVPLLQQYSRTHTFLFLFFVKKRGATI